MLALNPGSEQRSNCVDDLSPRSDKEPRDNDRLENSQEPASEVRPIKFSAAAPITPKTAQRHGQDHTRQIRSKFGGHLTLLGIDAPPLDTVPLPSEESRLEDNLEDNSGAEGLEFWLQKYVLIEREATPNPKPEVLFIQRILEFVASRAMALAYKLGKSQNDRGHREW
jgi:hypothetical protein